MVLSNKKLKQKLRAELSQNQTNSNSNVVDVPSSSNSLKNLLDSTTQVPRLSKREKRRKLRSLQPSHPSEPDEQVKNKESETDGSKREKHRKPRSLKPPHPSEPANQVKNNESETDGSGSKKNKKRKRKVQKDNDVAKDDNKLKNDNKKQQQKKKKKKNKIKGKTAEENSSNYEPNVTEDTGFTKTDTSTTTSQENGDVPTKVYVGGIPYYSTEDDIRSYFEGCGTITEVDCMTFPESGKFRGIAIVSFKTEAAAKRALALDGADMGGLFLKIQPYKATRASKISDFAPEIMEGYNRIYVGNLSWDITEEELRKFFKSCNMTSIRFGMDKGTGEFRGYAHVDFSDGQSLKTALAMDQNVLSGRPVRITCAVPLKKKPGNNSSSVSTADEVDGEKQSSVPSGKMKRRKCYECGEKGHNFSACPKKQTVASTTT